MVTSEKHPDGFGKALVTFVVAVIFTVGAFIILDRFMPNADKIGGVGLPGYLAIIMAPFIATMAAGNAWHKHRQGRPSGGRAWGFSLVAALILIGFALASLALQWSGFSEQDRQELAQLVPIILAGGFVFFLLMIRALLWVSFKTAENDIARKERLAAKKQARQGR